MPWTIIYYYHDKPIHLDSLYKTNPDSQILPLYLRHNLPPGEVWKNSDRVLRNLIIENDVVSQILYENILLLEYDNYVNSKIPEMDFESMMTPYSMLDATSWYWWPETEILPDEFKPYAIAGPPFCTGAIKKSVLIKILDPKYNSFFEQNIASELRTPTLVRSLGHQPSAFPATFSQHIKDSSQNNKQTMQEFVQNNHERVKGIFHPVKSKIIT